MSGWEVPVAIASALASQGPMLLVLLGGIVVALIRGRRHPLVSAVVALGCAVLLLEQIAIAAVYVILPLYMTRWSNYQPFSTTGGWDYVSVVRVLGILQSVLYALGVALLVVSTMVARRDESADAV